MWIKQISMNIPNLETGQLALMSSKFKVFRLLSEHFNGLQRILLSGIYTVLLRCWC